MAVIDIVILAFVAWVIFVIVCVMNKHKLKKTAEQKIAFDAVVKALPLNDYNKIDNVLMLYGDKLPKHLKQALEDKKTELFINSNS